jgi:hypothetical protein
MLKRYQSPNNALSSNVLNKLLDSTLSPMLSGTKVALTSKLFVSRSNSSAGTEDKGLSLNEFDEDRDHDRRWELVKTDTLPRPWCFKTDEARIGSNLGLKVWFEALQGFGRESVGE